MAWLDGFLVFAIFDNFLFSELVSSDLSLFEVFDHLVHIDALNNLEITVIYKFANDSNLFINPLGLNVFNNLPAILLVIIVLGFQLMVLNVSVQLLKVNDFEVQLVNFGKGLLVVDLAGYPSAFQFVLKVRACVLLELAAVLS